MKRVVEISNNNLVRNSDAYLSNGCQVEPDNEFSWIDNSHKEGREKFQLSYWFLRTKNFDIWQYLHEELQLKIFSYLISHDLITLYFVSKYH